VGSSRSVAVITTVACSVLVASCTAPVAAPPVAAAPTPAVASPPAAGTGQAASTFSQAQIDQMMAPIALYPDSLLSQVLMASTYPADVADAAAWSKAHPGISGDDAVKAVDAQPWDPSVKSLLAFPQVIQTMGDQPDWVQNLGDAFLASSKDVLDSAQRLRSRAQATGSLKSSEQQTVSAQAAAQGAITIEPANPQVVYVPAYDPAIVYGTWPYPGYPPYYYPPVAYYYPGAALATGIAFGIGVAATAALWGNCNWGRGDVNINVNRYNSINTRRQLSTNQTSFQHSAANRRGVPYRDSRSQQQYGRSVAGADQRGDFRGRDAQRQPTPSTLQQRGGDNAFRGAGGVGPTQENFNREMANRQPPARHPSTASSGARPHGSSAAARGGGGGARMGGGGGRGGGRGGGGRR
jgi:Protein of unknown function (DUF3300)